jgi:GNAT superfamily N-acetyltransferase
MIDVEKRAEVEHFIQFPFRLYQKTPQWVPPLMSGARRELNRREHPSYKHADAAFFVVESGGEILGRIGVMEKRRYNDYCDVRAAFFGFLELVDDKGVADMLFEAAFGWARERRLEEIHGPTGLLGVTAGGLLVEGFAYPPALMMPYNPPYYERFIEEAGFEGEVELLSGRLSRENELPERLFRIADRVKERRGFRIKSFESKRELREWVPRVVAVHREAFAGRQGYYPPTDAELNLLAEDIIAVADPRLIKLVMKEERVIGFIFAYPDISVGLQKCKGRVWPTGWFHLLRARRQTRLANVNGVGLLPAYQGLGANAILYTEVARSVRDFGFEEAELVQIATDNFMSLSDMETMGTRWIKRHRRYRRDLS